ncbi:ATP-binding cassette domain-containing protein [Microbacterium oryzae]|uniref:ABC transporter ATP-binding protein n=1 Tax=Microbacterium oryzae TaxID=743009 RepID=UPI0025AEF60F|nr:ATP-binding cassette domain-containing protein [Microbacterium oryzae]MDN3310843.1 ATP-binding cassette domain-containing protein [Microbacterium oryzae]
MTARVDARGWGWRHAGRSRWAVSGVDLVIQPGERVLLLGASGSGKSTLLRGLAGVLGDEEDGVAAGELLVDGVRPADARGRAGLVLQDPDAQVVLARVGDDVAFACENLGVPRDEIWRRVPRALASVGLHLPLDHSTSALSGGQKQRLALAGALAMAPQLLLLDEPTANLDPAGALDVRDAVVAAAAQTGATLVVVEHRVELWADHVDRVIVLAPDGGLLADGRPVDVFARHERELTTAGVWVPGVVPDVPRTAPREEGTVLLHARSLAVGRRAFGAREPLAVAAEIDAVVSSGRALAVVGPNGAGKSTLAATLAGLLPPVDGTLTATSELAGSAHAAPHRWSSRQLLTRIGMLFQSPEHQLLTASVRAELQVGPRALKADPAAVARAVDELLERLRLTALADVNPFTLSGGEKRRLTVAASLMTRPRVLVLDEPTYGQDARTWRELAALLDDVRAGGTGLVVVTHDHPLVAALADDVLALGAVPLAGAS